MFALGLMHLNTPTTCLTHCLETFTMAAPPPVFSDLFDDATKWDEPVPDYDALILLLGGLASTTTGAPALYDHAQTTSGLANLARCSPTLIAFCPEDNKYMMYYREPY